MKRNKIENLKKVCKMISMIMLVVILTSTPVFASAESNGITKGISSLSNMFIAIMRGVGGFLTIKSAAEGFTAWQQNDNSSVFSAVKGLLGGLGLFFLKEILGLVGVTI